MTREEARQWILSNCFTNDGNKLNRWKEKETIDRFFVFPGESFSEKVYLVLNKISKPCTCQCGNNLDFRCFTDGYAIYCSRKCSSNFSKGNVSRGRKNLFVDKKRKDIFLYKMKKTKKEKYGDENYNNRRKAKETNILVYGASNPSKNADVIEKIIKTKKDKSPLDDHIVTHLEVSTIECLMNKQWLIDAFSVCGKIELADLLRCSYQTIYNHSQKHSIKLLTNRSGVEIEIEFFIRRYYDGKVLVNDRKTLHNKKELDIYLPDLGFAIELNGSYFHSYDHLETTYERNRHKVKLFECWSKDINLLHITDYEWYGKKDLIKSMILHRISINNDTIGARQTIVKKIHDSKIAKDFYDCNHIQGYTKSCAISYGLYYNNELVSMMSFSKARFDRKNDFELMRFANKRGYKIHGGASKLLKAFRSENIGSIISYSANNYSKGDLYSKLGFSFVSDIAPRYTYYKGKKSYNRMNFQKKYLASKLEKYDPDLTEAENMFNNGYRRLWDSGKKKWVINKQTV